MPNLDLNALTDQEIMDALLALDLQKFLAVMNALAAIAARMQKRGELLSNNNRDDKIDGLMGQ